MNPVEVVTWKPAPDKPADSGYIVVDRVKTVREVYDEVNAQLPEDLIDEYFTTSTVYRKELFPYPFRRIVVFPVTGSSEGHYVHVEVLRANPGIEGHEAECVFLAKTFQGWEHAWLIAKTLGLILQV